MHSPVKSSASTVTPEVSALIRARLEAYVQDELDREGLSEELKAICRRYPDAAWEVLALLDQLHRQKHLTTEDFEALKAETQQLIFGASSADETLEFRVSADTVALDPGPHTPVEWDRLKPSRAIPVPTVTSDEDDVDRLLPPPRQQQAPQQEESLPPALAPAALAPGTVLRDRYVIEAPLGRGGMCTIFKALDRHRLNLPPSERYVAIKVLREEASTNPEAALALQDEFCIAQSLSHPNIINVFDLDHDGERHFITMELVDGESLSQMIGRMHPDLLPLAQAFEVIREVGIALQYAHDHGVVHADLKPGNIMMTRDGRVRVLDFGVASREARDPDAADAMPRLPFQAATPAYASRERVLRLPPDPRDDIYSLACIAYELLSGQRPFGMPRPGMSHPDRTRLRRIRGLTGRQWRTLRQGLAADRARRPESLREWLDGLELQRAEGDERPRTAISAGGRRQSSTTIGLGLVAIASILAYLVMSGTGPFRDLPWAVAARNYVSDALVLANDAEPAATRPTEETTIPSAAARAPARSGESALIVEPTVSEAPVVARGEEETAVGVPPAPVGDAATAEEPDEASETPPDVRGERSPVVRGPGVLYFTRDRYSVREGDTVARLTVLREAGNEGEVGFRWRTIGSSAEPGEDFAEFDATSALFGPGQDTAVLYIPIVSDALREDTETFYVEIESPRGGASLGPITRAEVVVMDDD